MTLVAFQSSTTEGVTRTDKQRSTVAVARGRFARDLCAGRLQADIAVAGA